MKKALILSLIVLLLTGCNVEYEVQFNDNDISNKMEFEVTESEYKNYPIPDNNYETSFEYFNNLNMYKYIDNEKSTMEKNIVKTDNGTKVTYTDNYTYDKFNQAYILNSCFENINYKNEDNSIYLELSGEFKCYYGETKILFKTDKKIIESNHDEKKSNTYVWNINANNKDNVDIIFSFGNIKKNTSTYPIISIIICIILGIISLILYKILKRNDY